MKTMNMITLSTALLSATAFAQLAPEKKFENQALWKTLSVVSGDGIFSYRAKLTTRGTYRVVPDANDFEFPSEMKITVKKNEAGDFIETCRDVYKDDRFDKYKNMSVTFRANPFAQNQRFMIPEYGYLSLGEFENPQVAKKIRPYIEWDNSMPSSDIATTWLKEPNRIYQNEVIDLLRVSYDQQKNRYAQTGDFELNLGTTENLRILACDLARGRAKLSFKFEVEGEPANAQLTDWIGNVNFMAIHQGLQETGDRPDEFELLEAGIAIGQEIQKKTERGIEIYQNGRAQKLLKILFKEKEGKFTVKHLNDDELHTAFAGLPEIKAGTGESRVTEDFITMLRPSIRMEEK